MRAALVTCLCLSAVAAAGDTALAARDASLTKNQTSRSASASRSAPPRSKSFRLQHLLTLNSFSDLTWSRDGRKLAFVVTSVDTAENEYNPDLWLWDAASGASTRLTRHLKPDISPTFSPGGDTIAFVSTRATGEDPKPAIYHCKAVSHGPSAPMTRRWARWNGRPKASTWPTSRPTRSPRSCASGGRRNGTR